MATPSASDSRLGHHPHRLPRRNQSAHRAGPGVPGEHLVERMVDDARVFDAHAVLTCPWRCHQGFGAAGAPDWPSSEPTSAFVGLVGLGIDGRPPRRPGVRSRRRCAARPPRPAPEARARHRRGCRTRDRRRPAPRGGPRRRSPAPATRRGSRRRTSSTSNRPAPRPSTRRRRRWRIPPVSVGLVGRRGDGPVGRAALPLADGVDDQQDDAEHAGRDAHPGDQLIAGDDGGDQGREADHRQHQRNDQHRSTSGDAKQWVRAHRPDGLSW